MRPLNSAVHNCREIAQGDLTGSVDINKRGEIGLLLGNLAAMQANLKAMLDEIKDSASGIDGDAQRIDEADPCNLRPV